jgi:hypothetical protein
MYNKIRIVKYLSDNFSVHNGLGKGNAFPPLLFKFHVECAIKKFMETKWG